MSDKYVYIGSEEKDLIGAVVESQELWRGAGDEGPVAQFEDEFAAHLGRRYVHANSSGTCANEAALAALGLEPGDVLNDAEGLANMRDLGEQIAWLMKLMEKNA